MNWDKQSIIAVVLGGAVLVLWYMFGADMVNQPAPPAPPAVQTQTTQPAADNKAAVPAAATEKALNNTQLKAMEMVTVSGKQASYTFQPVSGTLERVTFNNNFFKHDRKQALEITNELPKLAGYAAEYGTFGIRSERNFLTTVKVLQSQKISDKEYMLSRLLRDTTGTEFIAITRYKVLDNYQVQMNLTIANPGKKALIIPELNISAGDLQQWHNLSGDKKSNSQELHTIEYCTMSGKVKNEEAGADNDDWSELNGKNVRWFGVVNRFFAQLMSCNDAVKLQADRVVYPENNKEFIVCTSALLNSFTLAPQATKEFSFKYYLGPKQPKALRDFDSEATEVMHLGWFPIDFLAYIMLAILNWLYGAINSWGWSIILLTLLIRTIFFPVTMKANASMREMSALSPKLKEIREKYKDEPMVAQAKMSELYKEHKVNPMGGCLPMLIQIPVFIALYYALGSAAELRQQSFWWINDLAQPDTVCHIFGLAINPLIIAWTLLMVVQQKLTPTAMDPMQAKVMLAMPLVMLFILYTLPAALTLYWTVSQIFSIAQMIYQNKIKKAEEAKLKASKEANNADKPKIVRS